MSNQFKIFLLVALSFFQSFNLSANDTFFSIENECNKVCELANAGSKANIISKLDALGSLPHAKNFVNSLDDVADASLLSKLDGLDDATLGNLNTFYSKLGQNTPSPFTNTDFNFTATKTLQNGNQVSINYKNGFPDFHSTQYCPNISLPNGATGKYKYVNNNLLASNYDDHFKWANEKLLNDFGIQKGSSKVGGYYQTPNYRWKGSTSWFELKNANGGWDKYTWHHFQDGKTIIPVLSDVHNKTVGGFTHFGGNKVLGDGIDGVFEFPSNY